MFCSVRPTQLKIVVNFHILAPGVGSGGVATETEREEGPGE